MTSMWERRFTRLILPLFRARVKCMRFFALVIVDRYGIMTRMKYTEKLAARIAATRSALCVGLDPRPHTENMTELADWLRKVVEETAPYAAAYKPNIAYFEAMGLPGLKMLEELLPDMPKDILLFWMPSEAILARLRSTTPRLTLTAWMWTP